MSIKNTNLLHTKESTSEHAKDGRSWKTRQVKKLHKSLLHITSCKEGKVTLKDVLKTAAKFFSETATYKQAQQVIIKMESTNYQCKKSSFELIIPYLKKFKELNDKTNNKTIVDWETEDKLL
jgi:hypothetical protein